MNSEANRVWSQISNRNEIATRQDFVSELHGSRDEGIDEIDGHNDRGLLADLFYPTRNPMDTLKSFYTLSATKGKENPIFGIRYKENYRGVKLPSTTDNTWEDFVVL